MLNLYKENAWYASVVTNFITTDLRAPIHLAEGRFTAISREVSK